MTGERGLPVPPRQETFFGRQLGDGAAEYTRVSRESAPSIVNTKAGCTMTEINSSDTFKSGQQSQWLPSIRPKMK